MIDVLRPAVSPDAPMSSSSNIVKGNGRVAQERHTSWSLQQHDSATTLEGIMDTGKSDSFGPNVGMLNQQTLREFGMAAKRAGSVTSGLASRETSPERGGSIASYRASSRPGTAQTYSAAEIKKQYAAGPRSFASSSAKRPGLETGDVVALMSEGKAYKVSQAEVLEDEPGTTNYIFRPATTNDVLSDKAAHLEVIRQGGWVGFRSAAAEDRFLQLRRRGRQKLAFFSANFGVWEQWELVAGEPKQAWNTQRMGLRNRQLQQVVLTVDVVRVGTYAMMPNASMTSRSLIPLQGDVSENEELMKMSGLMIYEWFHFVDKEKQVRIRIDGKVNQMIAEAAELKQWTITEIEAIRSEMDIEVNRLIAIIHKKNVDLTDLETKLVNRLRWGIVVLQSKNESLIRRQVLQWWRMVAVYQHSCTHKVIRQLLRRSQMQQAMAFDVWLQYTQHRHNMRVHMQMMVTQAAHRTLSGAFQGWAQFAAASAESKMMLHELEQQAIWRMQRWRIACLLYQWRTHAQGCKAGRQCLEAMQLRNQRRRQADAFQTWVCVAQSRMLMRLLNKKAHSRLNSSFCAWSSYVANFRERKEMLQAQWSREVRYIQRTAINKWRFAVAEARRLRHACNQIQQHSMTRCMWQAFAEWRGAARRQRICHQIVDKAFVRRSGQQVGAVFLMWRRCAQQQQRNERLALQRAHHARQDLLAGVMSLWLQHALTKQRVKAAVARCQRRHASHLLQHGFQAFQVVTEARKARAQLIQGMLARLHLLAGGVCIKLSRRTDSASSSAEGALAGELCSSGTGPPGALPLLRSSSTRRLQDKSGPGCHITWQLLPLLPGVTQQQQALQRRLTLQKKAVQGRLAKAVRWMSQRGLASAFAVWSVHALQMRGARQAMQQVAARMANRQLAAAFYALQENAQQQLHARQTAHKLMLRFQQASQAAAFDGWLEAVHLSRHNRQVATKALKRITNLRLSQAFDWWRSQMAVLQDAHARAGHIIARMQNRCVAAAFQSWAVAVATSKEVAARRTQMVHAAVTRSNATLLGQMFVAWTELAGHQVGMRKEGGNKLHRLAMAHLYGSWASPSTWLHTSSHAPACMAAVMAAWSHALQVKQRHTRLLQCSLGGTAVRLQLSSLRAWQAVAQHKRHKRVALMRLLSKHLLNRKRHAFHRWHAAWQERCQALERLRVCISRKRISFRLFKQWYWESFDDDVQATLGHMFNTTEEAISSPLPSPQASSPRDSTDHPKGRLPHAHLPQSSPSHGTHASHLRDFSSLYESPAGPASQVLLLEGQDGNHLNPTQSRFSRTISQPGSALQQSPWAQHRLW
ncbi:hypothetical protein WJX79_008548 [Trebouxia sp. C0005]